MNDVKIHKSVYFVKYRGKQGWLTQLFILNVSLYRCLLYTLDYEKYIYYISLIFLKVKISSKAQNIFLL